MIEVQLPTASIDLDNCSVMTLQSEIDDADVLAGRWPSMVDQVVEAGEIIFADTEAGTQEKIHWGRTAPVDVFRNVIVDVPMVTLNILRALRTMGVINGDFPESPDDCLDDMDVE